MFFTKKNTNIERNKYNYRNEFTATVHRGIPSSTGPVQKFSVVGRRSAKKRKFVGNRNIVTFSVKESGSFRIGPLVAHQVQLFREYSRSTEELIHVSSVRKIAHSKGDTAVPHRHPSGDKYQQYCQRPYPNLAFQSASAHAKT